MTRALVTGSEGFIGSVLCEKLESLGVEVVRMDLHLGHDLRLPVANAPEVDTVFHLAAHSDNYGSAVACFQTNVQTTITALDLAYRSSARFILASTYLQQNATAYSRSKRLCEDMALWYRERIKTCIVRCCNVYGPGDKNISRLVPKLITSMFSGAPTVQVSRSARDFVYIDDCANAYVAVGMAHSLPVACDISGGELVALETVAQQLSALTRPTTIEIGKVDYTPVLGNGGWLNIIGWSPEVPLKEGLAKTVDWWRTKSKL